MAVILPKGWINHGSDSSSLWLRPPGNGAALRVFVTRAASLPAAVAHDIKPCEYMVYAATAKLQYNEVQWDQPLKTTIGEQGHPALITRGTGPKDSAEWEVYCIEAHVGGNKKVRAVVGWRDNDKEQYKPLVVNLVKSWRG